MNIQPISTSFLPPGSAEASVGFREIKLLSTAPEKAQPAQPASQEQLTAAVQSVLEFIKPTNNDLDFSISEDTGQLVVKIIDRETNEVIRQMPSEEMIAVAKALDNIKGLFVKQKA